MGDSYRQLALALSGATEATFASFVPGRNGEALAALQALANGERGAERFVYLWGAPGSGRSHLLAAVANAASAAGRHAVHFPAGASAAALEAIEPDAVVALGRVERLEPAAQTALFVLYNRIREGSGALVVAGDAAPARLAVRPDLATRLAWGLVYEVHALDDEEKGRAMRARAAEHGFDLPADAEAYVLRHSRRDLPALLDLVDLIERHSLEAQRPVTLPLVREVMQSVQRGAGRADQ